jgi:hypothetical protein
MFSRALTALTLALMGVAAMTAPAFAAADSPDQDSIMLGTFLLVLGVMSFLFVVWMVKHYFGADRMPPAPADDGHGGHH